jgi:dihydrofolate reductase
MLVSMIVAMDRLGLIGTGGALPWHLPRDLRRFREYTWGKPIIMGRTTFESIGKPLPGRFNIVLTHQSPYGSAACQSAPTLEEALSLAEDHLDSSNEAVLIGGGTVYAQAIQRWDRLYLTLVDGDFTGTTFFPLRELLRQRWRPAAPPHMCPVDEKNRYAHSFHILQRDWVAERTATGSHLETALPAELDLAALLARGTV